jgi:hypothetical protein
LKNENGERAVKCLKEVIELDENNVKGLLCFGHNIYSLLTAFIANFRMGKAYLILKDSERFEIIFVVGLFVQKKYCVFH